jgi:hypothetical protein
VITAINLDVQHQQKCVIQKPVKQLRQTENANILKHVRWLSVVTDTRAGQVSDGLSETLHKSMRKLAQQTAILYDCCCKAANTLQLFPYEIHVIQQLLQLDCEKCHHSCEWLLAKVEDDTRILDTTLISDEA